MSAIVDTFIQQVINSVEPAAKIAGLAAKDIALDGVKEFLTKEIPQVEGWVQGFLNGTLPVENFKQLLEDLGITAIENCLRIAGLAEVEIDKTRNTLLQLGVSFASSTVAKLVAI